MGLQKQFTQNRRGSGKLQRGDSEPGQKELSGRVGGFTPLSSRFLPLRLVASNTFAKLLEALPEGLGKTRKTPRPKEEQDDEEDNQNLGQAQTHYRPLVTDTCAYHTCPV